MVTNARVELAIVAGRPGGRTADRTVARAAPSDASQGVPRAGLRHLPGGRLGREALLRPRPRRVVLHQYRERFGVAAGVPQRLFDKADLWKGTCDATRYPL